MSGEINVSEDRLRTMEIAFATLSATVTTKIDGLMRELAPQYADHEARLRKLEAARWLMLGAAMAGGGVLGTIGSNILSITP